MDELKDIEGFDWDEGNRTKNWVKHQVSATECEEVFLNLPLLLADDTPHSQAEKRFYVLGQTDAGRRLFLAFTIRANQIRVISARDMSRKEQQKYDQINP
jgi:uncharacterized DUF497 family protein